MEDYDESDEDNYLPRYPNGRINLEPILSGSDLYYELEPIEQEAKDHLEDLDRKIEQMYSYTEELNQMKSQENLNES